ncbi:hypothetical protein [Vampirovibrio sp.]|uniref:hypothetical protein n=1 Tax=Vampirovibrio sp. TaxID=2717857 RepID=UPI003593990F
MFPISPPSQTRPLNPRLPLAPAAVRFGKTRKAKLEGIAAFGEASQRLHQTREDLNKTGVQDALKGAMAKYQYTIAEDFFVNYNEKLTFNRAQNQINHLWNNVTGEDLKRFYEAEKLGLVEESSDMFFEMYTLKALYSGLITKQQVKKWSAMLPQAPADGKPITEEGGVSELTSGEAFEKARQAIKAEIKKTAEAKHPWAYDRFRKMVNQGWVSPDTKAGEPDRALDLLALVGMKCALMTRKDPGYRLWGDNIQLLCGEAEELREEMHGDSPMDSPAKWLIAGMAKLYGLPLMPAGLFQKIIVHIVGKELNYVPKDAKGPPLKFDIDYKDLMETVYSKQIGRQELDYSRPDIDASLARHSDIRLNKDAMKRGNAKRKCILKPYELWQESAVLKNALQEKGKAKESKIAEKVLHTGASAPEKPSLASV